MIVRIMKSRRRMQHQILLAELLQQLSLLGYAAKVRARVRCVAQLVLRICLAKHMHAHTFARALPRAAAGPEEANREPDRARVPGARRGRGEYVYICGLAIARYIGRKRVGRVCEMHCGCFSVCALL